MEHDSMGHIPTVKSQSQSQSQKKSKSQWNMVQVNDNVYFLFAAKH